ncbi:MAG: hypothetical protein WCE58_09915, partial [Gallionella sp.]
MTYPLTKWNACTGTECGMFYQAGDKRNAKHLALGPLLDEHYDSQGRNDYSVILPHHTRLTASRLWLVIMK